MHYVVYDWMPMGWGDPIRFYVWSTRDRGDGRIDLPKNWVVV